MDLIKNEILSKLKSFVNSDISEKKEKNFSFYLQKIQEIAPLSFERLKKDFIANTLPSYFKEIVINHEFPIENIFYYPLFLKKNQKNLKIEDYIIELIDYEFVKFQTELDSTAIETAPSNKITTDVFLNPFSISLRHEYDIHEFINKMNISLPARRKTLLLVAKDPISLKAIFFRGTINHAAIIDELHDGKLSKKSLLQMLNSKYPDTPQSEWVIALRDLKDYHFILER